MRAVVYWIIAFAQLACSFAYAQAPETRIVDSPAFDTREQAVVAAFERITQPFARSEFGGAILERDGRFFYTQAVTTGQPASLDFVLIRQPEEKLVGLYHTHPDLQAGAGKYFSPDDIAAARALKAVLFIADEASRTLWKFDPKHAKFGELAAGKPAVGMKVAGIAAVGSTFAAQTLQAQ